MSQYSPITTLDKNVDEQASQPNYIKLKLKPHQLMMIKKCIDIETNGVQMDNITSSLMNDLVDVKNMNPVNIPNKVYNETIHLKSKFAAICDIVGSGKTYTALSLVKYDMNNNIDIHRGNLMMSYSIKKDNTADYYNHPLSNKICLIVVPHVILIQWRKAIIENTNLTMVEYQSKSNITDVDLILVSCSNYKNLIQNYPRLRYKRVFFDEADSISISKCPKPPAAFYWFMTSSFVKLLNKNGISHHGFIRETFNETPAIMKKYLLIKNDDVFVQESFNIPDTIDIRIKCKTNQVRFILENIVSDTVQRMICAVILRELFEHLI